MNLEKRRALGRPIRDQEKDVGQLRACGGPIQNRINVDRGGKRRANEASAVSAAQKGHLSSYVFQGEEPALQPPTMDVTKLIRGVRSREPLWDRKHSYYHDRTVTMALWDDVAFSIGVDSETARTKWKGLRDTFRGELRKLHKTLINGRPRTSTNWEYFDEMMFVKDQIYSNKRHLEEMANHVRHHSGQVHSTTDDSNSCDQHRINGKVKSEPHETLSSPETEEHEPLQNGKEDPAKAESLPPVQENHDKAVEDNECEKRKRLKPSNDVLHKEDEKKKEKALDDDDFNFLMSLLPQMRCLPTTRNLFIRLKIQELLYNEMVAAQMRPTV